jgi:hypothetical protein
MSNVYRKKTMNKTTHFHAWHTLWASMITFMLLGCGVTEMSLPTAPPYNHYVLSDASNIRLEFDYPGSWIFSDRNIGDMYIVSLVDPRFITVPTPAINELHPVPSNFGSISIRVRPLRDGQTLDILVEPHKQGNSNADWITPLDEDKILINGYKSVLLETQVEPIDINGFSSLMFQRDIFFIVKDRFYHIVFLVAEKERGGEFEQGYEYFFKSIRITP